jgi:hypothetical protein
VAATKETIAHFTNTVSKVPCLFAWPRSLRADGALSRMGESLVVLRSPASDRSTVHIPRKVVDVPEQPSVAVCVGVSVWSDQLHAAFQ